MSRVDVFFEDLLSRIIDFVPELLKAIIILIVGILIIKLFKRFMNRLMLRKEHDPTVLKFLMDLITWVLRIVLLIAVITKLGVPNTSFVAVLGAAGLAIGLSLQGSLSNFAGGILIILFKPMRVGDFIEAQGQSGTVSSIQIFSTKIVTSTNQVIYIPNGILSNGVIKNYSKEETRRTDLTIGVSYDSDLKHVKSILSRIADNDPRVLKEPAPAISVKDLGENAVNFQIFLWARRDDYWSMLADFLEAVKNEFETEKIVIPSPQRDLYIKKNDKGL